MRNILRKSKRKSVVYAAITFVVLMVITELLVYQRHRAIARNEYNELALELDDTRDKLNIVLNHNISSARTVAIMCRQDPSLTWFDNVAKDLMETNETIDMVEFVDKDFFITHIYPLKGSEHMVGFNVMSEPVRRAETQLALKNRTIKFSGPYTLLHAGGGLGIAGRLPIYDGDKFLGGAVVITRLSTIRKRMPELENKGKVFSYQLSKVNPLTKKTEYFFDDYKPQKDWQASRFMRRGNWTLHVAYVDGYISHWWVYLLMFFCVLFSGLGALFVYSKTHEAIHLDKLVKRKTRDLDERMKELTTIYQVNEVLKDEWQSIDIAFSRIVKLIPEGFQYPQICAARITFDNHDYKTDNCIETPDKIQAPLNFQDGRSGYIEVSYVKDSPIEEEGPFMKEERRLLNALAETIEIYVNKKMHQDKVARSEAALRSLVEASQIGVMLCDNNFNIIATNKRMVVTYEALSGKVLQTGDNFVDALRPERKEYVLSVLNRVRDDFEPVEYETSYEYLGATVYVTVSVAPVSSGGKAIGVCMVVYDITSRKLMELERQHTIDDMKERINALENFAKVIATKVSAPLSTIVELKSLVKEDMHEQERLKILEGVILSAQQLEEVLNDLRAIMHEEQA